MKADREDDLRLFFAVSDSNGVYRVDLPAGRYFVASDVWYGNELDPLVEGGVEGTNAVCRSLYDLMKERVGQDDDQPIHEVAVVQLSPGKTVEQDVVAGMLFVD